MDLRLRVADVISVPGWCGELERAALTVQEIAAGSRISRAIPVAITLQPVWRSGSISSAS